MRDHGLAMRWLPGVVGVCLLAATVAGAMDYRFNDARLLYAALGRDGLVAACLPELERQLQRRGFSPLDVEVEPRPRVSLAFGASRSLAADFTFQDGAAATRVDGRMECEVRRDGPHVDLRTSDRPVRVG